MTSSTVSNLPGLVKGFAINRPRHPDQVPPLVFVSLLLFAAFCGLTIPVIGFLVPALVGVLVLCVIVLALSPPTIVQLLLVLVLLVVGQFTYFFSIQQATWVPYLLLLLIGVKYLIEQLRITSRTEKPLGLSNISVLISLFGLSFFLSALANGTDVFSVGVAAKNYIFPWFLTLLVATAVKRTDDLRRLWKFMLWVVVLQVPFAIPQHFYYAKLRVGDNGLDAVVGSFGGSIYSGGASGAMAIFLVFGIVLASALYQQKQIGLRILIAVLGAAFTTVALAEVKIFFVALPLALILLFRWRLISNPGKTIGYGIAGLLLLFVLTIAYQQTTSNRLSKANSLDGYINHALTAESDPYMFNPITREVSRVGAVLMWVRYNDISGARFYLGHGPAASRQSQTLGSGVAAKKYPFTLTTSTASTLLWDVGILGYTLLIVVLLAAGLNAQHLARSAPHKERAVLDTIGVMLLLAVPLSFYNRDLIDSAAIQTLVAFWIGYVLLCRKCLRYGVWSQPPKNTSITAEAK